MLKDLGSAWHYFKLLRYKRNRNSEVLVVYATVSKALLADKGVAETTADQVARTAEKVARQATLDRIRGS